MKMTFSLAQCTLEVDGETQQELFTHLASAHEVFNVKCCGACGSTDIRPQVREQEGTQGKNKGKKFNYYEYICQNPKCRARLAFGQLNDGSGMFPKRKDENGAYLENNGWVIYKGGKRYEEPAEDAEPARETAVTRQAAPVASPGRGGATNGRLPQQDTRGRGKPAVDEGDIPF